MLHEVMIDIYQLMTESCRRIAWSPSKETEVEREKYRSISTILSMAEETYNVCIGSCPTENSEAKADSVISDNNNQSWIAHLMKLKLLLYHQQIYHALFHDIDQQQLSDESISSIDQAGAAQKIVELQTCIERWISWLHAGNGPEAVEMIYGKKWKVMQCYALLGDLVLSSARLESELKEYLVEIAQSLYISYKKLLPYKTKCLQRCREALQGTLQPLDGIDEWLRDFRDINEDKLVVWMEQICCNVVSETSIEQESILTTRLQDLRKELFQALSSQLVLFHSELVDMISTDPKVTSITRPKIPSLCTFLIDL
jgi:hypothetical protein